MTQGKILSERRFWPLFWTQFLGAFNDNLFKNALVFLVTFRLVREGGMPAEQLVILAAGIFIFPFFLFSGIAGQIADRYPKDMLIRWIKGAEIAIMALAGVGFATAHVPMLLAVLFLMGTQSSFFGPVKYSIIPDLLAEDELVGGNALVETGTFVAILLGTITAGVLIEQGDSGLLIVMGGLVVVAVCGLTTARFVPAQPAKNPGLTISRNPMTPILETYRVTRRNRTVFLSVLGISWFWFVGAGLLAILPTYTKEVVHGTERVLTYFLSIFCIGIATGSLLCEGLSRQKLELGLVPFGSIGLSIALLDLFWAGNPWEASTAPAGLIGLGEFLAGPHGIRISLDLAMLAIFSGLYTVPLYTLVQQRSDPKIRSQVIAGNNILNALLMVGSAVMLLALRALDVSYTQIMLVLAVLNAVTAIYIYTIIPEFLLRFVIWILANVLYRIRVVGGDKLPVEGPAVLIANHVSFVDWLLIASACKHPARFVMDHSFLDLPVVGFFFRDAKVIPIAPARESVETMEAAFDKIAEELEHGEIICIFPEGRITQDGELNVFRPGIEKIVQRTPAPVYPVAIKGMWGSYFSRKGGRAMSGAFRAFRSRVEIEVADPVPPDEVTAKGLAEIVAGLGGWTVPEGSEAKNSADARASRS